MIVRIIMLSLALLTLGINARMKVLVFGGKTGYLGQKIIQVLDSFGYDSICAESRLEDREALITEIGKVKPYRIINAAGLTGKPNIDWCDNNKQETIRVNLLGTLNLIDVAFLYNIHITNISTGCFYKYDDKHPISSGIGFKEEDEPNFHYAFYSEIKIYLEKIALNYPNLLNLRITMPISADLHPKNFIIKLSEYKKIMNVPISLTVLEDLLPIAIDMTMKEIKGNYNFVNPGTITHDELLDLYKEYINPQHTYESFPLIDQIKILQSKRSHCELSAAKLLTDYPYIPYVKDSVKTILQNMKERLKK